MVVVGMKVVDSPILDQLEHMLVMLLVAVERVITKDVETRKIEMTDMKKEIMVDPGFQEYQYIGIITLHQS